jgi:enoyl-CoA hydratase/carnithine racemase
MENKTSFARDGNVFSAKEMENIIIFRFKESPLLRAADLRAKAAVLDYLNLVSRSDLIKVVVIMGSPQEMAPKEYVEFYRRALELDQIAIQRMHNAVNQFILGITELNKIVIHADSRKFLSLFLNVSLACDYRIVTDNSVFHNLHLELGLVPKGGEAFFLSKMLGFGKVCEILLSAEDITAQEALRLGIVNEVVPSEELEKAAFKTAQRFAQKPALSLSGVKRLVNYSNKDLGDYLEFENEELFRIMVSSDFQKKLGEWTAGNF